MVLRLLLINKTKLDTQLFRLLICIFHCASSSHFEKIARRAPLAATAKVTTCI
jgi:hypothetical protein